MGPGEMASTKRYQMQLVRLDGSVQRINHDASLARKVLENDFTQSAGRSAWTIYFQAMVCFQRANVILPEGMEEPRCLNSKLVEEIHAERKIGGINQAHFLLN